MSRVGYDKMKKAFSNVYQRRRREVDEVVYIDWALAVQPLY